MSQAQEGVLIVIGIILILLGTIWGFLYLIPRAGH